MIIQNNSSISISLSRLRQKILKILTLIGVPKTDLDITFVGDASIRKLNHQFRKKNKVTDVLSFPLYEKKEAQKGGGFLGDIVVSLPCAKRQAKARGVKLEEELIFLIIHGTLHLLGYDHEKSAREAKVMQKMEKKILDKIL